eukprot:1807815-Amphidinium_carterae.2
MAISNDQRKPGVSEASAIDTGSNAKKTVEGTYTGAMSISRHVNHPTIKVFSLVKPPPTS